MPEALDKLSKEEWTRAAYGTKAGNWLLQNLPKATTPEERAEMIMLTRTMDRRIHEMVDPTNPRPVKTFPSTFPEWREDYIRKHIPELYEQYRLEREEARSKGLI